MPKKFKNKLSQINKSLSVGKTILAVLGEMGEGTIKSFFPHPYYHTFCSHSSCQDKGRKVFSSTISKLEKRGLIVRKKKEGSLIFCLTSKGEKEAFNARLNAEILSATLLDQRWDGKWRFIFFDIPESKRRYRVYLRKILKTLGFKEFQKSVWAYPFPIPSFISDVLWDKSIRQYTRFIVTKDIDYEEDLRKLFF